MREKILAGRIWPRAGVEIKDGSGGLAEAIPFHLEGLRAGGEPVPLPESAVEWVEV